MTQQNLSLNVKSTRTVGAVAVKTSTFILPKFAKICSTTDGCFLHLLTEDHPETSGLHPSSHDQEDGGLSETTEIGPLLLPGCFHTLPVIRKTQTLATEVYGALLKVGWDLIGCHPQNTVRCLRLASRYGSTNE